MYILFLCIGFGLHKLNIAAAATNTFRIKKKKFKSLMDLVATQHSNIAKILWVCLCMIFKAMYIDLIQILNRSVVKTDKHTYEVSYVVNGRVYTMHVKTKRGPRALIQALDENDRDLTEKLQAYLGPMEDFHGAEFTPEFFGAHDLTVHLSSGVEVRFSKTEPIRFSKAEPIWFPKSETSLCARTDRKEAVCV